MTASTSSQLDWAHSLWWQLRNFTPADLHLPTLLITLFLLLSFFLLNRLISTLVSSLLPPSPPPLSPPSSLLDFFLLVGRLKTTKRTGWLNHAVPAPESIADHMYRLAIMAYVFSPPPTSLPAVFMAVTHDLAEAVAGDITPPSISGVSLADKKLLESAALSEMLAHLTPPLRAPVRRAWEGYEEGRDGGGAVSARLG